MLPHKPGTIRQISVHCGRHYFAKDSGGKFVDSGGTWKIDDLFRVEIVIVITKFPWIQVDSTFLVLARRHG